MVWFKGAFHVCVSLLNTPYGLTKKKKKHTHGMMAIGMTMRRIEIKFICSNSQTCPIYKIKWGG